MLDSDFLKELETKTGFSTYESMLASKSQFVFYGTSDKYEEFKELIGKRIPNGTIAYLMDTMESHMYSLYKNTWF